MTGTFSIYLEGLLLGRLVWCEFSQVARFEPSEARLSKLGFIRWFNAADARVMIIRYALEAGLGGSSVSALVSGGISDEQR